MRALREPYGDSLSMLVGAAPTTDIEPWVFFGVGMPPKVPKGESQRGVNLRGAAAKTRSRRGAHLNAGAGVGAGPKAKAVAKSTSQATSAGSVSVSEAVVESSADVVAAGHAHVFVSSAASSGILESLEAGLDVEIAGAVRASGVGVPVGGCGEQGDAVDTAYDVPAAGAVVGGSDAMVDAWSDDDKVIFTPSSWYVTFTPRGGMSPESDDVECPVGCGASPSAGDDGLLTPLCPPHASVALSPTGSGEDADACKVFFTPSSGDDCVFTPPWG